MTVAERLPTFTKLWRALTGRVVRWSFLAVVALLCLTSAAIRLHTFLVTRKIQAVISALSKLRIDETSEDELLKTTPYLVRSASEYHVAPNNEAGDVETGIEHFYYATFGNQNNWMRFESFAWRTSRTTWFPSVWFFRIADLMGYRYLGFRAGVFVLNGRVSKVGYGIANTLVFPEPVGEVISVESFHSRWAPRRSAFYVPSIIDESPQFYVEGDDSHLSGEFSVDASSQSKLDAFQVNLNCFWRLSGCEHARQIAPRLWEDKLAIERAALARLQSDNPCPDRILTGRVRYYSDVSIALLEATGTRPGNTAGGSAQTSTDLQTNYKLVELLRGAAWAPGKTPRPGPTVTFPGDLRRTLQNKGLRWVKKGERVLAFYDVWYDSCQLVPATPSALAAIQSAVPAVRRSEDEKSGALQ